MTPTQDKTKRANHSKLRFVNGKIHGDRAEASNILRHVGKKPEKILQYTATLNHEDSERGNKDCHQD